MDLRERVALLPTDPGVYLYKDADGTIIYVGKAKNLRSRVRNYFSDDRLAEAKTGTLISVARSLDYILVDNEKEALALENNLIKQHQPRFNILLKDDKTYPYIKITAEKYPRVYVTRRLNKTDTFYGPYFPGNLAYRLVDVIHRRFKVPSCKIDLNKVHPQPCLEFHIKRCLGPCAAGLTTENEYAAAARRARMFLEGKHRELAVEIRGQIAEAAEELNFERAASLRDLLTTIEEMDERQKMSAASGDDIDIFAYHVEPPLAAVNLFHVRNGRIVDRKELFWENLEEIRSMPENLSLAASGGELRHRIERILNPSKRKASGAWLAVAIGTMVLGCSLLISAAEAPQDKAKEEAEQKRRIEYSKTRFGSLEDERSKTYIKFGAPDELEVHPGKDEKWMYHSQNNKVYTFDISKPAQAPKTLHEPGLMMEIHMFFMKLLHGSTTSH